MNVRTCFVGRPARRDGMIYDVVGFMHEVGCLRSIRLRRLFDHAAIHVQKR